MRCMTVMLPYPLLNYDHETSLASQKYFLIHQKCLWKSFQTPIFASKGIC